MTITETTCEQRVNAYAWPELESDLDAHGCAILRGLLDDEECRTIASTYANPAMFRSRIVMARHGFGRGEYQYFAYPLPRVDRGAAAGAVSATRARRQSLARGDAHPDALPRVACCVSRALSCRRPDAAHAAPACTMAPATTTACIRMSTGTSSFRSRSRCSCREPGEISRGGEFVLTEQRPRMQSRAEVVPLKRGDAVIFAVRHRPVTRHARQLSRQPAPRRQPHPLGIALHARHHLSRRDMTEDCSTTSPSI